MDNAILTATAAGTVRQTVMAGGSTFVTGAIGAFLRRRRG